MMKNQGLRSSGQKIVLAPRLSMWFDEVNTLLKFWWIGSGLC